ncbi:M1 family metallopeptidase [Ilyomonas limi]|uniref:Aminopeptidase N n=1 Tax=Ilyomonas limi TaxID=2575867 RepID=A0A4U3L2M4_9BACT|nr:M1 family metallopeptidase [Ilyomonas limi]TKK69278.1 M1 family metallopeptidase [Ilyomonas limi]
MKKIVTALLLLSCMAAQAQHFGNGQQDNSWKKEYRASATKINDVINTRLDVKFDFDKAYLYGKAWLTLHPHFYPTDSLTLDAKGMDIHTVALVKGSKNILLKYTYDSLKLNIRLDKTYKANENYVVYIDYTSKPNELKTEGSAAITDAKGLYFINPKGTEKNKPTEIWTQGETSANSVWFPTIDETNQKTTEEITMTVPAKYVTLSNGLLVTQKTNSDGTRTDTWKMDKPHSPYLFFMGVGDFAIVKDKWRNKEVNYYVEKEYAPVARKIFGLTPEMIQFYSTLLHYDFPWQKYSQMTGRDYVSGAMENTTATLHTDAVQQNARQLVDGNKYEDYVSHELFHQWFGDLVTAESWSNLTLNESFANYSEVLWREHKYGKEEGERKNYEDMQQYLGSPQSDTKNLVRFYYQNQEDMFDLVSYQKGGRILNMLRHYLGDSAFFKGLNLYLHTYEYGNAEAHQLRQALEQVSGKDLNWFFNQWYFGHGHPMLSISYDYDANNKTAKVFMKQVQQQDTVFQLPFAIDVYNGSNKTRYNVWMKDRADTFYFPAGSKPDLINVDADKYLLAEKQDNKTLAEYVFQYNHAGNYVDKIEALQYAAQHSDTAGAMSLLNTALKDAFYDIRTTALQIIKVVKPTPEMIPAIETIAHTDAYRPNRAAAIDVLGTLKRKSDEDFFIQNTKDSSYSIAGAALEALLGIDEAKALSLLPTLSRDAKGRLEQAVESLSYLTKTDADFDTVYNSFATAAPMDKIDMYSNLVLYLRRVQDVAHFKKAVDAAVNLKNRVGMFVPKLAEDMEAQLQSLLQYKQGLKTPGNAPAGIDEEINYLQGKLK